MAYIIETERLFLREFDPEKDAEAMFLLNDDPEVMKYTGDVPFESIQASYDFLSKYSDYRRNGYGRWVLELKETGEILGWSGIKFHNDENFVDVGYRLMKKYWGKGYATESAAAALKFGFSRPEINEIVGRAHHDNHASIRVFDKLGLKKVGTCEDDFCDVLYKITRDEYLDLSHSE